MEVTVHDLNNVRVFAVAGRFDAAAAPDVQRAFEEAMADAPPAVVLDLSGVEYISSGGVRAVIVLSRLCKSRGAELKLCGLNAFVKQVFELSNLTQIFAIYPGRDDAISSIT